MTFTIHGQKFMLLNGGPQFRPNPTISFFVYCDNTEEIELLWQELGDQGTILMPLDKYDWSDQYGWVEDRYGTSWQLMVNESPVKTAKIAPCLMFCGEQQGKAEPAIQFTFPLLETPRTCQIITQGKDASAHGELIFEVDTIAFADFYEFTSAGSSKIRRIVSYARQTSGPERRINTVGK